MNSRIKLAHEIQDQADLITQLENKGEHQKMKIKAQNNKILLLRDNLDEKDKTIGMLTK